MDVEVWREVAKASPSTFHVWANAFSRLQTQEIIEACWLDTKFRSRYTGERSFLTTNLEKFPEFVDEDFLDDVPPFRTKRAANAFVKWYDGYNRRVKMDKALTLLANHPDAQGNLLIKTRGSPEGPVLNKEALESFIENRRFYAYQVKWVLKAYTQEFLQGLTLTKFQDPIMALIFGSADMTKRLNETDYRHYGYLSLLNVRNEQWAESFQLWLTRHGKFNDKLMVKFRGVEMTRDLEHLDDEFFTDGRLSVFENLLSCVEGIKLRMPAVLSIKFKELFLVSNDRQFRYMKRAIVDGRRAFGRKSGA